MIMMVLLIIFISNWEGSELRIYTSAGYNPQGGTANLNKITEFNNGIGIGAEGESWTVNYQLMSNPEVYLRGTNSINAWFSNDTALEDARVPVFDFNSTLSLVRSVNHSIPAWENLSTNLGGASTEYSDYEQVMEYVYHDAKLQAGGRGFLGFGQFDILDTATGILTQNLPASRFSIYRFSIKSRNFL